MIHFHLWWITLPKEWVLVRKYAQNKFCNCENWIFGRFQSTLMPQCDQTAWDNLVFSSDSGSLNINLRFLLVLLGSITRLTWWKIGKCKIILVSATGRYINYYINFKIEFLQKGSLKHFQTFSTCWHWPWAELPPSGMLCTFFFFKPYLKTGVCSVMRLAKLK